MRTAAREELKDISHGLSKLREDTKRLDAWLSEISWCEQLEQCSVLIACYPPVSAAGCCMKITLPAVGRRSIKLAAAWAEVDTATFNSAAAAAHG